jgi:ubiquinone/menaquinone biosynthesis C-methylase UbiE
MSESSELGTSESPWPQSAEDVERLNDQLAREHSIDEYYVSSPYVIRWVQKRRLRLIERMVEAAPGSKVLDVGSGGGHVLRMFPQAKLTAVDVSDVYLDIARRNLAGYDVAFHKGQIETLGLPAQSFDRIICTEVLEHTTNPGEILHELARLVHPSGRVVITVPVDPVIDRAKAILRKTPVGWLLRNRIQWGGDRYHLQKWWPSEFQALLERDFVVQKLTLVPVALLPFHACFLCRPRS